MPHPVFSQYSTAELYDLLESIKSESTRRAIQDTIDYREEQSK